MDRERLLPQLSAAFSVGLTIALGGSAVRAGSQLGFAQAADSLMDAGAALLLAWSARIAREPRDKNHQLGHTRAEALGALAVATLSLLLGFEVIERSLFALFESARPDTSDLVPIVIVKLVLKSCVLVAGRRAKSPALRALVVDARNDVLVALFSLLGLGLAHFGHPGLDAWLALPLGVYIVRSGIKLAAENVALLMGQAPEKSRQEDLRRFAEILIPPEGRLLELKAQHLGADLALELDLEIPGHWTVSRGAELADQIRNRLELENDVFHAAVVLHARKSE